MLDGYNVNTMSRRPLIAFLDRNVNFDYVEVKSVGGQTLQVAGDKVRIQTEVDTTMGKIQGVEEFLILDNDAEDMVMGSPKSDKWWSKRPKYPDFVYE